MGRDGQRLVRIAQRRGILTVMDYLCLCFGYKIENGAENLKNSEASTRFPPPRWHRQAMSIRGRILKQWNFSSRCLLESMLPRLSLSYHKTKKPSFADTVYEVALGSANDDKDYSKINLNAFLDVFALSLSMQLLRVNESFLICLINPTHDIRSAKNNCF